MGAVLSAYGYGYRPLPIYELIGEAVNGVVRQAAAEMPLPSLIVDEDHDRPMFLSIGGRPEDEAFLLFRPPGDNTDATLSNGIALPGGFTGAFLMRRGFTVSALRPSGGQNLRWSCMAIAEVGDVGGV